MGVPLNFFLFISDTFQNPSGVFGATNSPKCPFAKKYAASTITLFNACDIFKKFVVAFFEFAIFRISVFKCGYHYLVEKLVTTTDNV